MCFAFGHKNDSIQLAVFNLGGWPEVTYSHNERGEAKLRFILTFCILFCLKCVFTTFAVYSEKVPRLMLD